MTRPATRPLRWLARPANLLAVAAIILACTLAVLVVDSVQSRDRAERDAGAAIQANRAASAAQDALRVEANSRIADLFAALTVQTSQLVDVRTVLAADTVKIDALRAQLAGLGVTPIVGPAPPDAEPAAAGRAPAAAPATVPAPASQSPPGPGPNVNPNPSPPGPAPLPIPTIPAVPLLPTCTADLPILCLP